MQNGVGSGLKGRYTSKKKNCGERRGKDEKRKEERRKKKRRRDSLDSGGSGLSHFEGDFLKF